MENAIEKRSSLAIKLEMSTLTGTLASSGTAITGTNTAFDTELNVGDVIGTFANGFRRVTAVGSATACTVDVAFDVALSGTTCSKQNDGYDPSITSADVMEFVPGGFTLEGAWSEIARNIVSNTYDETVPILGEETVSGDVTLELHGSGTAGTPPDADPLFVGTFGERHANVAAATTSGSSTTSIKLASNDGLKFRVGDAIMLDPTAGGTGAYEVSWITVIATDTLTVSPAFSVAPPTGRTIHAGVHYTPSRNELKSMLVKFWRGDITLESYPSCKVATAAFDFKVGTVVNPKFTLNGGGTGAPSAASYSLGTPTFDSGNVHVARYMAVKIGGVLYQCDAVAFQVANTLYRVTDVTTSGTRKLTRTARQVTGSFSLLYQNKDVEAAFRAATNAEIIIVSSDGSSAFVVGNTFAVRMQQCRYTKVTKATTNGIYQYQVTFRAAKVNGEDSIFASML